MILTPLNLDITTVGIGESGGARAPGLHASDIYGSLYQELEPKRYRNDGEPPPPMLLETGLIFETALEEGLARRFATSTTAEQIIRPGEFTHSDTFDGHAFTLAYNPDLHIYNGVGLRVGEIKATWMSSKIPHEWLESAESRHVHGHDIAAVFLDPKYAKHFCQLKFYMYMQRTTFGRFYYCFIAGDYSRPYRSQLVAFDVEVEQDELDYEYGVLIRHAIGKGLI